MRKRADIDERSFPVTVSIKLSTLRRIEVESNKSGISRSAYITNALEEILSKKGVVRDERSRAKIDR